MKSKLLSFACILAMSVTCMFTTAQATENGKISLELDKASTDTNKIINVYFEDFEYVSGTKISLDLKNIRDFIAYPADASTNAKKAAYVKDNCITAAGIFETGFQSGSLIWSTFKYNGVASAPNSAEPLMPSSNKELVLKVELPLAAPLADDVVVSLISDGTTSNTYVNYVVEADTDTGFATGGTIANSSNINLTIEKPAPVVPDEPELVENPYVFSFDADEETEVKITNSRTGDRTYSLPSFVKGGAKVNALLKIKDSSSVQTGDKFTIDAIKGGKATTITTIEVE